ncbi:MAG: asparaginase [Ruminococcaceae bacterium]|nr:asparaginase [Oscillospiraceae bacterium]
MTELIHEYRGSILENIHCGHICIVDERGGVVHAVGNAEQMTYYRSASKPIQALPVLMNRLDEKFGLSGEEIAIMAGSHSGESCHRDAILSMLKKAGYAEEDMIMNPVYPEAVYARDEMIRRGDPPRKALHNCSGKHVGLMLLAGMFGNHRDYWHPDSKAQKEVKKCIANMAEWPEEKIEIGIDGCGVPVFAVPLRCIAFSFLKLLCPELIADECLAGAAGKMSQAMQKYPLFVKGTDTLCTLLNSDSNVIAKGGAQGVYAFALKRERLGVVIKQADGTGDERPNIVAEILRQIHYSDKTLIEKLEHFHPSEIINDNGTVVGSRKAVFTL